MIVDGQRLSKREVRSLLDMVRKDAEEIAGQFYDQCRSKKFRLAWTEVGLRAGRDPQRCFAESKWQNFVEHVRTVYVELMTKDHVAEADKYRMHQANIVQAIFGIESQAAPVQLAPSTQQFVGDKYENRKTSENFGDYAEPHLVNKLMASTAIPTTRH
jgi:hypothetical protein